MTSKIISFVITSLALLYLALIPLGIIDQHNRRFALVDLGIFVSILLINSDKLSQLKLSKDGFSIDLKELKQNQETIKNQQKKQDEDLRKLQEAIQLFLTENQNIIEKIKYVKLPDSPEALAKIIADHVIKEIANHPPDLRNILTTLGQTAIASTAKRKSEE